MLESAVVNAGAAATSKMTLTVTFNTTSASNGTYQFFLSTRDRAGTINKTATFTLSIGDIARNSETLSLSASSASVVVGDTATLTLTNMYTPRSAAAWSYIHMVESAEIGGTILARHTSDSMNTSIASTREVTVGTTLGSSITDTNVSTTRGLVESVIATTAGAQTKQTITVKFYQVQNPGTYTITFTPRAIDGTIGNASAVFTLTVTAVSGSAATSLVFLNKAADFGSGVTGVRADSSVSYTAGTAASPTAVAVLWPEIRNSSDTKTVNGNAVADSITVTISGPGLLAGHINGIVQTRAKQVTIAHYDTIIVYSDGTAGTATITSYLGTSVTTAGKFAQAAKSVTFTGPATTFTASAVTAVKNGGNLSYSDSTTSGTGIITFTAKDAAGTAITSAAMNTTDGQAAGFYAISSDSKVISGRSLRNYSDLCTYSSTDGYWSCNMFVVDSGTATLTIYDSTTASSRASSAVSYTVAGAVYTGTLAFDKTSYAPGEVATITITAKDRAGRNVANGEVNPFTNAVMNKAFSGVGTFGNAASAGFGANGTGTSYTLTGSTFVNGVETVVVQMPSFAGKVTFTALTNYDSSTQNTPVSVSVDVVNPDATAANAAIAASQAAADAATDAALEAIDAANAATDAANLAAEAADAATVAAEEARDAADAATAAVEALATEVASMMAALKAQITTLARTVAKIAKKVNA